MVGQSMSSSTFRRLSVKSDPHGNSHRETKDRKEAVLTVEESAALRRDMARRGVSGFREWVLHVLGLSQTR